MEPLDGGLITENGLFLLTEDSNYLVREVRRKRIGGSRSRGTKNRYWRRRALATRCFYF